MYESLWTRGHRRRCRYQVLLIMCGLSWVNGSNSKVHFSVDITRSLILLSHGLFHWFPFYGPLCTEGKAILHGADLPHALKIRAPERKGGSCRDHPIPLATYSLTQASSPVSCIQSLSWEPFCWRRSAGAVPRVQVKGTADFKLRSLKEVCSNAVHFLSEFSTFSSQMSLDVTF